MRVSKGELILMLDADGATEITEYNKIEKLLHQGKVNGDSIVIGSRNHLVEEVVSQRAWYRNILMHVNNFIVNTLVGIKNIKDTQCGFKLFTRSSMRKIFTNMHLNRWAFDVEMIYIAQR